MHDYLIFCSRKYKLWVFGIGSIAAAAAGILGGLTAGGSAGSSDWEDFVLMMILGIAITAGTVFFIEILADMDVFSGFIGRKASCFGFMGGSEHWESIIKKAELGNDIRRFITALIAGLAFGVGSSRMGFMTGSIFIILTVAIFAFDSLMLFLTRRSESFNVRTLLIAFCTALAVCSAACVALGIIRGPMSVCFILLLAAFGVFISRAENRSMIQKGHRYYFD